MTESYEVDTAALTGHARTLGALSGELAAALAGAGVSLSGDAFGETGRQVAEALRLQAQLARAARNGRLSAATRAHVADSLATLREALAAPLARQGA